MTIGIKRYHFYLSIFIFVFFIQITAVFARTTHNHSTKTPEKKSGITYNLNPKLSWKEIDDLDFEQNEHRAFQLSNEKDIRLTFSFEQGDLLSEFNKIGIDKVVENILVGKNEVYSIIGKEKVVAISKKIVSITNGIVLTIQTQYKISNRQIDSIEKYYMFPNETLFVSLSWFDDLNAKVIESAISELGNIGVEWGGIANSTPKKVGSK